MWFSNFFVLALCLTPCISSFISLRPPALLRLPVGASKPTGWLHDELTLQARGLTGQLPWFYKFLNHSDWVTDDNETFPFNPAEVAPYYLNGAVPLSFQLPEDENLASIVSRYVGYILAHQDKTTGYLT